MDRGGKCFLIGYPVSHSLSPVMFQAAFRALGLDWSYEAVPVPPGGAGEVLRGLGDEGALGVNVTMPLKQEVLAHAALVTPRARLVGAANTLTLLPGTGWEADNTDWPGLGRAIAEVADRGRLAGGRGVVFGAGGAAAAAAFCLREMGLAVVVVNRDRSRGGELARRVGGSYLPWGDGALPDALAGAAVVVNATPLGMGDRTPGRAAEGPGSAAPAGMGDLRGDSPLPAEVTVAPGCVACDLVYHPVETEFLRRARAQGALLVTGLAVLLWQGVLALERWTGRDAPVGVMRGALEGAVEGGRAPCVT